MCFILESTLDIFYPFVALEKVSKVFAEKQQKPTAEKTLMSLAWDLKDLEDWNERGRKIIVELDVLHNLLTAGTENWFSENIPRMLSVVCGRLSSFVKAVSRYKRTAATHVFVFMVRTEDRRHKPYSLPVQCIPYKGLPDQQVRKLADAVVAEMTSRGMKVAGMVH